MRHSFAPVGSLVAQQQYLYEPDLYKFMSGRVRPDMFGSTPVVEHEGKFLLCDSHHRTTILRLGIEAYGLKRDIPIRILENDSEIKAFCALSNYDSVDKSHTLKSMIARHRKVGKSFPSLDKMPVLLDTERHRGLPTIYASLGTMGSAIVARLAVSSGERVLIGRLPSPRQFDEIYSWFPLAA